MSNGCNLNSTCYKNVETLVVVATRASRTMVKMRGPAFLIYFIILSEPVTYMKRACGATVTRLPTEQKIHGSNPCTLGFFSHLVKHFFFVYHHFIRLPFFRDRKGIKMADESVAMDEEEQKFFDTNQAMVSNVNMNRQQQGQQQGDISKTNNIDVREISIVLDGWTRTCDIILSTLNDQISKISRKTNKQ